MPKSVLGKGRSDFKDVFLALILTNLLSFGFLAARAAASGSLRYGFMGWNLILGWLPLLFAWLLCRNLTTERWSRPINVLLSLGWLAFLPNSFYIISDLVHLHFTGEVSVTYDAVMFFLIIFNSLVIGYMSVFIVHRELLKRLKPNLAHTIIGAIFLLIGFAVYLGRYLRWNSWDILFSPAGLLFDVSERVVNPSSHPQVFSTTLMFFLLLSGMYLVIWRLVRALSTGALKY